MRQPGLESNSHSKSGLNLEVSVAESEMVKFVVVRLSPVFTDTIPLSGWPDESDGAAVWAEMKWETKQKKTVLRGRVQNNHYVRDISMSSSHTLKHEHLNQQAQLTRYPQEQTCQMDKHRGCHCNEFACRMTWTWSFPRSSQTRLSLIGQPEISLSDL